MQAGMKAQSAKYQYEAQAIASEYKEEAAKLAAKSAAYDLIANQQALQRNTAIAGMRAAQQMAATRNAASASGVAMDSASKYEVSASERYNQTINLAAQEQNRLNQFISDQNKIIGFSEEAILGKANAAGNRIMGSSIDIGSSKMAAGLATFTKGVTNLAAIGAFSQIQIPDVNLGVSNLTTGKTALEQKGTFTETFEFGNKVNGGVDYDQDVEIFQWVI